MSVHIHRFSLIEVLIALTVTSVAAMGIFRLQTIGMEAVVHADLVTRAAVLAESRIERAITEARVDNAAPQPDSGVVRISPLPVEFRWDLAVDDATADFPDLADEWLHLWFLRCRVTWGSGRAERRIELNRYVWDYDFAP